MQCFIAMWWNGSSTAKSSLEADSFFSNVFFQSRGGPCPALHGSCPCSSQLITAGLESRSPRETRWLQVSRVTLRYSLLWARSSCPHSSCVKVTATSLKLTGGWDGTALRMFFHFLLIPEEAVVSRAEVLRRQGGGRKRVRVLRRGWVLGKRKPHLPGPPPAGSGLPPPAQSASGQVALTNRGRKKRRVWAGRPQIP